MVYPKGKRKSALANARTSVSHRRLAYEQLAAKHAREVTEKRAALEAAELHLAILEATPVEIGVRP